MVPLGPDLPDVRPPDDLVDPLREADDEPTHAGRESGLVGGLHDEVHVIPLEGPVRDVEASCVVVRGTAVASSSPGYPRQVAGVDA